MLDTAWDRGTAAFSRLLAKDRVFSALQQGLAATLVARKVFERNVGRVLSTVNVPSRGDLERLVDRMDALDKDLGDLLERVEAVHDKLEADGALRGRGDRW